VAQADVAGVAVRSLQTPSNALVDRLRHGYARGIGRLPPHLAKAPVGRQRLSREELDRHQRQRILEAATGVFAKRGYPATTIDNIVAAAEVGVGGFYAHFDGKEECLLAAYEQIVAEAREQIAAAVVATRGAWPQKALAALRELLVLVTAEPLRARLALVEIQTGGPVAQQRYGETIAFAIDSLAGGRKIVAAAPAPPQTQEAATANGLAWLLAQRLLHSEAKDEEGLFEDMAEVVLDPYLGAAKSRREIALFRRALAKS
jgi:AcrR family transcriptional regulator